MCKGCGIFPSNNSQPGGDKVRAYKGLFKIVNLSDVRQKKGRSNDLPRALGDAMQ